MLLAPWMVGCMGLDGNGDVDAASNGEDVSFGVQHAAGSIFTMALGRSADSLAMVYLEFDCQTTGADFRWSMSLDVDQSPATVVIVRPSAVGEGVNPIPGMNLEFHDVDGSGVIVIPEEVQGYDTDVDQTGIMAGFAADQDWNGTIVFQNEPSGCPFTPWLVESPHISLSQIQPLGPGPIGVYEFQTPAVGWTHIQLPAAEADPEVRRYEVEFANGFRWAEITTRNGDAISGPLGRDVGVFDNTEGVNRVRLAITDALPGPLRVLHAAEVSIHPDLAGARYCDAAAECRAFPL